MSHVLLSAHRARELADQHEERATLHRAIARLIQDAALRGEMGVKFDLPDSVPVHTEQAYNCVLLEADLVDVLRAAPDALQAHTRLAEELRKLGYGVSSRTHKREGADPREYAPVLSWLHVTWNDAQEARTVPNTSLLPHARAMFQTAREVQAVGRQVLAVLERIAQATAVGRRSVPLVAAGESRENRKALIASLVGLGYEVDDSRSTVGW